MGRNGQKVKAHVHKQTCAKDGSLNEHSHRNLYMDIREYNCIMEDGEIEWYTANIIAENLYAQCDSEGQGYIIIQEQEISDHSKDASAIPISDGYLTLRSEARQHKKTTRG